MKSKKLFTISIVIIVALLLLALTYININSSINNNLNNKGFEIRLASLGYLSETVGKNLIHITLEGISNNDEKEYKLKGNNLLFVLSTEGCNICIWQELDKIKEHINNLSKNITIKFIYLGDNHTNALRYNKFMPKGYDIFLSLDSRLERLNPTNKYPYLLYLKNDIIIDCHFPIPTDTTFSELFYKRIEKKSSFDTDKNNL